MAFTLVAYLFASLLFDYMGEKGIRVLEYLRWLIPIPVGSLVYFMVRMNISRAVDGIEKYKRPLHPPQNDNQRPWVED